jgi:pimeloyl-ACP methyl ester carboxylesterase
LFWRKTQYRAVPHKLIWPQLVLVMVVVWSGSALFAQPERSTVTFCSADSLLITADKHIIYDSLACLVLIHEQGSSRSEFNEIVDRFLKMNFNCLSVDVRNGGNSNFIPNETAKRARQEGISKNREAVEADIRAAISYAYEKTGEKVILLGAGANGALALKAAKELDAVRAAIALSPGEFFLPLLSIQDTISGIQKPILVTSSRMELPYIKELMSNVAEDYKTIFAPENSEGERGTNALLSDNPSNSEYWLAVLLFFKELQ